MKLSKKIARKIIFPSMMKLGIDKLLHSRTENVILNIMYHGVVSEDSTYFSPRHITKKQFEEHLKYYKNNFDIISLSDAFYYRENNIKPKKHTLTISFDDGFQNNLRIALPLLEKYDIKTTFFISSVCAEDMEIRCLWSELISAINYFYKNQVITHDGYQFKNLIDRKKNINLINFIKSLSCSERDQLIEKLILEYDLKNKLKSLPSEIWALMTKEELIKLSNSKLVEISSHGHLHYNLANINKEDAKNDMLKSKQLLEKITGKEINMIAYPDGSYNEEVKNIAQEIGYLKQLAVGYKNISDKSDVRIMNRHGISSTTTFESNMIVLAKALRSKGIKIK